MMNIESTEVCEFLYTEDEKKDRLCSNMLQMIEVNENLAAEDERFLKEYDRTHFLYRDFTEGLAATERLKKTRRLIAALKSEYHQVKEDFQTA